MSLLPDGFECEEALIVHLEKIFEGEYNVPLRTERPLTILDIGANVGAYALWASKKWPGSTVYSYEPHPKTFEVLLKNTKLTHENIVPFNYGLGAPVGFVPLYEGGNNSGEATIFPGNSCSKGTAVHVEIKNPLIVPEADIIKIDAEGSELDILDALIMNGRKFAAVCFEFHRVNDRRDIDLLLCEYVLTGCHIGPCPAIGTMNYVHKDFMSHWL